MNMSTKPASYPFLAIARKYGYPYADVLNVAFFWDRRSNCRYATPSECLAIDRLEKRPEWREFTDAVHVAMREQDAIRAGVIDWQTGEPSKLWQQQTRALRAVKGNPVIVDMADSQYDKSRAPIDARSPVEGRGSCEQCGGSGWTGHGMGGDTCPRCGGSG
jgi:hypothetical protein